MSQLKNIMAATVMMAAMTQSSFNSFGDCSRGYTKNNDVYGGLKKIKYNKKKKKKRKK